jgi:hypothetical protein
MGFCFSSLLLLADGCTLPFIDPSFTYPALGCLLLYTLSGHQPLLLKTCNHKVYEEGHASSEKSPMAQPGTTMHILEAAKRETPQCIGLLKKM